MLIIKPFNLVYFIFVGTVFISVAVLVHFLNKMSLEKRRKIFTIVTGVVAALLLFYKFSYRLDPEFIRDYPKYWGEYTIFNELPINPCNIVILMLPFAVYYQNAYLLSFCFFMGSISTTLAITMPQQGYAGYSITKWHTFGFFLLHSLGVALSISLIPLKLYKPCWKDIAKSSLTVLVTGSIAIIISFIIRKTGLCEFANYYFSMDAEGNPVLEFFYRLIPIPGLYIFCTYFIYVPGCFIIILIYKLFTQKNDKKVKHDH